MDQQETSTQPKRYQSFAEFYPDYLAEHAHSAARALHVTGTVLAVVVLLASLVFWRPWGLLLVPVCGYGFAWMGHVLFEKNQPTTFRHPFYSLLGDLVLVRDVLSGKFATVAPEENLE